jgi:hypothetical protein
MGYEDSEVGLTPEEAERARLPEKPKDPGSPHQCAVCKREIESDGFCAWHGPLEQMWLCDAHVHELRMRGNRDAPPKTPMTREAVEHAICTTEGALMNMAMIDAIAARDASGASRGFELSLTYKQSRPIIKAILDVLKVKLTAFPPPAPVVEEVDPE